MLNFDLSTTEGAMGGAFVFPPTFVRLLLYRCYRRFTIVFLYCKVTRLQLLFHILVSSRVGRIGCWHAQKSLRKHSINLIAKPIDKLDHRCAGEIL